MLEFKVLPVKYVFLDVVDFTKGRTVESQISIVSALNEIVTAAIQLHKLSPEHFVLIPTGDGICIGLIGPSLTFDIHLLLAISILKLINQHNLTASSPAAQFEVRISLNENDDNLYTDINGNSNLNGAGINMAARILDHADGGQIILTQSVHDRVSPRDKYAKSLRSFRARLKHGVEANVFQFIQEETPGLNVETPQSFQRTIPTTKPLTVYEAYFIAHAQKHRPLFLSNVEGQGPAAAIVMCWFLTLDSVGIAYQTKFERYSLKIYGKGSIPIEQVFKYYRSVDYWLCEGLASRIGTYEINQSNCFESDGISPHYQFPNENGIKRLKQERPDIYNAILA